MKRVAFQTLGCKLNQWEVNMTHGHSMAALEHEPCNAKNRTLYYSDNLLVLRGINSNSVDLIYLDPPFNKNETFVGGGSKLQVVKDWYLTLQKKLQAKKKRLSAVEQLIAQEDYEGLFKEAPRFDDVWRNTDIQREHYSQIDNYNHEVIHYLNSIRKSARAGTFYYLIFMSIRLVEMHRVLKDTGSVCLHCDPTMSHYLKIILDKIFGHGNFRNEITWNYKKMPNNIKAFQRNHDTILFYTKSEKYTFNVQHGSPTPESLLTFKSAENRGYNVNLSKKMATVFSWEKYHKAVEDGKIPADLKPTEFSGGNPPMRDYWIDIKIIGGPKNKERVGYPTQKPLALLERIIKTISNEGDVVLDPFCGCATTCVAAERLKRHWIGIDGNRLAFFMIYWRVHNEGLGTVAREQLQLLDDNLQLIENKTDFPERTDRDHEPLFYEVEGRAKLKPTTHRKSMTPEEVQEVKDFFYEEQAGICNGCDAYLRKADLTIDHIIPQAHDGTNEIDNLQLLCYRCNNWKWTKTMDYLIQKLYDDGIIPAGIYRKQMKRYKGVIKNNLGGWEEADL